MAVDRFGGRRILRRMPRIQLYLPDDLYQQVKEYDLPASKLFQNAVREELDRRDKVAALEVYLDELRAEVGEPSTEDWAWAEEIVMNGFRRDRIPCCCELYRRTLAGGQAAERQDPRSGSRGRSAARAGHADLGSMAHFASRRIVILVDRATKNSTARQDCLP